MVRFVLKTWMFSIASSIFVKGYAAQEIFSSDINEKAPFANPVVTAASSGLHPVIPNIDNTLDVLSKLHSETFFLMMSYLANADIASLRGASKKLNKSSDDYYFGLTECLVTNFTTPSIKTLSLLGYQRHKNPYLEANIRLLDQQIFILDKASLILNHPLLLKEDLDKKFIELLPEDGGNTKTKALSYLLPSASFEHLLLSAKNINHPIAERIYLRMLRFNPLTIKQLRSIVQGAYFIGAGDTWRITNIRIIHHPSATSKDIRIASENLIDLGLKELGLEGYHRLLDCDDLSSEELTESGVSLGYIGATQLAAQFIKKNLKTKELNYLDYEYNLRLLCDLGEEGEAATCISELLHKTIDAKNKRYRVLTTIAGWLRNIGMKDLAINGFSQVVFGDGFELNDVNYATWQLLLLGHIDKATDGLKKLSSSELYKISEEIFAKQGEITHKKRTVNSQKLYDTGANAYDLYEAAEFSLKNLGDKKSAMDGFTRALELDSINTETLFETCVNLVHMGHSGLAMKGLSRLLDTHGIDLNYMMHIAWLSGFIGRIDFSAKTYMQALQHSEIHNQPTTIYKIASNLIRLGYIEEGIDAYKLALINGALADDDIMDIADNLLLLGQQDLAIGQYLRIQEKKGSIDDSLVLEAYNNLVKLGAIHP